MKKDNQPAPVYPETLPCPVLLEPGMRFRKGVKTRLVLEAIQRRAEHYAELEAMTPEERAEYDAGIEAFKAMLPQPVPVSVPDFGALTKCIVQRLVDYGTADDDTIASAEEFVYNACRAAMLQAEPVTTANKLGNSPVIPDGYVMVPKEPTGKQWSAGVQAFDSGMDKVTRIYKAMLAAAPQEVNGE